MLLFESRPTSKGFVVRGNKQKITVVVHLCKTGGKTDVQRDRERERERERAVLPSYLHLLMTGYTFKGDISAILSASFQLGGLL